MSLPAETRSHHTVWIDIPGGRTVSVRYVSDGDRLLCLGDDGLSSVPAGSRLPAALRSLACGPMVSRFWIRVEEAETEAVSPATLADLLGDRSLGRTADEVNRNLETMRSTRRFVVLEG